MAIKLERVTESKKALKIISVMDSAIDWEASYSNEEDLKDDEDEKINTDSDLIPSDIPEKVIMSLEEQKKDHYRRHHDISKLKFKLDDEPTLFVFAHPHRVDVSRRMRELASGMFADTQKARKEKVERDIFTNVFHNFYLGTEQGFSGIRTAVDKVNFRITDDAIQALEDAEVFIELNSAFMRVYNEDRSKNRDIKIEK